jgi:hypothetical protein
MHETLSRVVLLPGKYLKRIMFSATLTTHQVSKSRSGFQLLELVYHSVLDACFAADLYFHISACYFVTEYEHIFHLLASRPHSACLQWG